MNLAKNCLISYHLILMAAFLAMAVWAQNHSEGVTDALKLEIFELKTNPDNYKKMIPPQDEKPIRVNVSVLLIGSGKINDLQKEFDLDVILRISWHDKRLRLWSFNNPHITVIEGGLWHLDRIWIPSLHMPNSRQPNILQDKTQNPMLARINSDGLVLLSKRIDLEGINRMEHRLYPLDLQMIKLEIESNEISFNNLRLYWNEDNPFSTSQDFSWNDFEMVKYELIAEKSTYVHTGNFSKVVAKIYVKRFFSQFLFSFYVPICLFVVVSWGSFWVEISAAPARVTLGLTVLLTMVTTARSFREKLPSVQFVDIWTNICIIFVFCSIIEYVAVNYIYHFRKRYQLKKNKRLKSLKKVQKKFHDKPHIQNHLSQSGEENQNREKFSLNPELKLPDFLENHQKRELPTDSNCADGWRDVWCWPTKSKQCFPFCFSVFNKNDHYQDDDIMNHDKKIRFLERCEEMACEIDRLSRIIFPSLFLCFNLIYWIVWYIVSCHQSN